MSPSRLRLSRSMIFSKTDTRPASSAGQAFSGSCSSTSPGRKAGAWQSAGFLGLEPVKDLVRPEPLEALESLVEAGELVGRDTAHLLDRAHVLLVEQRDDV